MKRLLVVVLAFVILGFAASAFAQTPATTTSKIGWDQVAPSLEAAQAYTYKYYADVSSAGVVLTGVTCVSIASPTGSIIQCEVPFPAFTPGNHTLTLTASSPAGESAKSAVLNFAFVVIPSAPANLRIK